MILEFCMKTTFLTMLSKLFNIIMIFELIEQLTIVSAHNLRKKNFKNENAQFLGFNNDFQQKILT